MDTPGSKLPPYLVRNAQWYRTHCLLGIACLLIHTSTPMLHVSAFRAPASVGRLNEVFSGFDAAEGTLVCGSAPLAKTSVRCTYTPMPATQLLRHRGSGVGLPRADSENDLLTTGKHQGLNTTRETALYGINSRRGFVGGNWKCNGTLEKTEELLDMLNAAPPAVEHVDVIVAPPSLFACQVKTRLQRPMHVAAQDSSIVRSYGAFTGELSPKMLRDAGIEWVVLGHSERRAGFGGAQPGETNEVVAGKVKAALDEGLKSILCIGETLEQREKGETTSVLSKQLKAVKEVIPEEERWNSLVVAYEPVWAIGTGRTATPQQAQDTHKDIRQWIRENISPAAAEATRIIYGGSVKGSNAKELFQGDDVDGFLVGGASLTKDFYAIIEAAAPSSSSSSAA